MASAIDILNVATKEIGTKESPTNSNRVKYNTWYYGKEVSGSAYPWCCVFVAWVFNKAGASKLFYGGKKTAYCPTVENYYKSIGRYYANTKGKAGDLCLMDFGKGRASHIGIVESKNADGSYNVIEGNTSTTSNDNGGSVMRRVRRTNVIRGFARPDYESNSKSTSTTSTTTSQSSTYTKTQFIKDVQSAIGAKVDGIAGNETLSKTVTISKTKNNKHLVVKPIQRYLYVLGYTSIGTADGVAGTKFDTAVKAFQKANGCTVDGEITAQKMTWKKLLGLA